MTMQATPSLDLAELTLRRHCPLVTCGQSVLRGERLATASAPGAGDIHTPIAGVVTHVDAYRIRVEARGHDEVEPVDLAALSGKALYDKLLELGVDLPPADAVDTLIVNGVDAEQGVLTRASLLASTPEPLEHGLKTIHALYKPRLTTLAVLKGASIPDYDIQLTEIDHNYPAGLDPLVALAVTGIEAPDHTEVIGLETVYHLGRVMRTGLPVLETPVTVDGKLAIVPVGMPVSRVLGEAGIVPAEGDRIVLGGFLRGEAAALPTQGVDRSAVAVTLVRNPAPVAEDVACVGCGECVRRCPARLDPSMITSYAEFGLYDKAAQAHVEVCFECGLCGFFCLAHRPMLQYIRLAKSELARARSREEVAL
ncbi:4Fe-4S dicluster domain-containing protein [Pseudodesulfovibrio sp.]|uniref:4Fe-4S dicluster domain-containing protein n=1 Tax=Pseudodesulfovibrio sp. TaxID=2035812 RepID=UPI0026187410|nr:4Fe-4S dicluster domain-containing protein [Pseudodesulfovibrio sp.]MDD3313130.1 4Fe-4S dicluster domain-containing protein [Pseudodesulfovibrio sp.]